MTVKAPVCHVQCYQQKSQVAFHVADQKYFFEINLIFYFVELICVAFHAECYRRHSLSLFLSTLFEYLISLQLPFVYM